MKLPEIRKNTEGFLVRMRIGDDTSPYISGTAQTYEEAVKIAASFFTLGLFREDPSISYESGLKLFPHDLNSGSGFMVHVNREPREIIETYQRPDEKVRLCFSSPRFATQNATWKTLDLTANQTRHLALSLLQLADMVDGRSDEPK